MSYCSSFRYSVVERSWSNIPAVFFVVLACTHVSRGVKRLGAYANHPHVEIVTSSFFFPVTPAVYHQPAV